ncbi:MAG: hypothetical protein ACTSUE_15735 [Promethearchaeota archaeon]
MACKCECEDRDLCSITDMINLGVRCPVHEENVKCREPRRVEGLEEFEKIDLNPNYYDLERGD